MQGETPELISVDRSKFTLKDIKVWKEILRGNFLVLLSSWIVWRFSMRLAQPYRSPFIINVLGGSATIIGLMSSVSSIIRFIVFIPGGYIADKWGRKRIISIMTFFMAASYLFYVFAADWRWAFIASIVSAAAGIYMPALRAMTADSLKPEYRGIGFTLQSYMPSIPAIFSPTIGAILIQIYGFETGVRFAFTLQFISGMTAAMIRILFLKETLTVKQPEETSISMAIRDLFKTLKEVPKEIWCILIAAFIGRLGQTVGQYRILYYTQIKGLDVFSWGLILTISGAISIILGIIIGYMIDKYGRRRMSLTLSIAFILSTLLFINAYDFYTFLIAVSAITVTRSGISAGLRTLQADLTPRRLRGRINAVGLMLSQLILIPIGYIAGAGYEVNPITPFTIDIAFATLTTILLLTIIKEPEKIYY